MSVDTVNELWKRKLMESISKQNLSEAKKSDTFAALKSIKGVKIGDTQYDRRTGPMVSFEYQGNDYIMETKDGDTEVTIWKQVNFFPIDDDNNSIEEIAEYIKSEL